MIIKWMDDEFTFIGISTTKLFTADGNLGAVKLITDEHVPQCTGRELVHSTSSGELLGHINVLTTLYPEDGVIQGPGGVILSR